MHSATRWFLARLIFIPEDGRDVFLRNAGSHTDYTALYPQDCKTLQNCSFPLPPLPSIFLPSSQSVIAISTV
jgi:hypothetical protein